MKELIERLRVLEIDHEPEGWPAIKMKDVSACLDLIESQAARIASLEKIIQRQQFIEDRYEELMLSCRRVYRYYGADTELFNASVKVMDFLIRRHATEIDEMNEE